MTESDKIYSVANDNMALLKDGEPFQIGEILNGYSLLLDNTLSICWVLKFTFGELNSCDQFYFDEELNYCFGVIQPSREAYLISEYTKLVKKEAGMDYWIETVKEAFVMKEMGF